MNRNVDGCSHGWMGGLINMLMDTRIPDICHFFYTGKIFREENLHRNLHIKLPIYTVNCQFFALNL